MPPSRAGSKGKSRPNNKQKSKDAQPATNPEYDHHTNKPFLEALEDVHTRFILNLPASEIATSERIFFQIEQAWWFYEDFVCDDMDQHQPITDLDTDKDRSYASVVGPTNDDNDKNKEASKGNVNHSLPRFKNVRPFAKKIFEISPLLSPLLSKFDAMWNDFAKYRRKISTYGTILLNKECTKVILCQDWSGKAWTFPAGKVNQNERGVDAGARETYEETGFDPNCLQGRTKLMKESLEEEQDGDEERRENVSLPWGELKEGDDTTLGYVEDGSGKRRTCFVCWGVPESFPFAPVARKEVLKVEWHDLNNLPKKTYAIIPFMTQLKRWIRNHNKNQRKNKDKKGKQRKQQERTGSSVKARSQSQGSFRSQSRGSCRSNSSRSIIAEDDDVFESGLGNIGDDNGWGEDEMFTKNEELIGHKIDYDGNPQKFATKGFDGNDPHAFHVVGGELMNSGKASNIDKSSESHGNIKQILDCVGKVEEDHLRGGDLKPFFSDGGVSPWGDMMAEALAEDAAKIDKKKDKTKKRGGKEKNKETSSTAGDCVSDSDVATPRSEEKSIIRTTSNAEGLSIMRMLKKGNDGNDNVIQSKEEEFGRTIPAVSTSPPPTLLEDVGIIMLDKDITARSQNRKLNHNIGEGVKCNPKSKNDGEKVDEKRGVINTNKMEIKEKQGGDTEAREEASEVTPLKGLCEWANSLPKSEPTKHFGDFRFDVDSIMKAMKSC